MKNIRKLKTSWIGLLVLALALGFGPAAQAQTVDAATPMNIGPLSPVTTFPLWVQDSTGLTLEICPGTDPVHCISVPPFTAADIPPLTQELVDFSQQIGFGDEGFYGSADAIIPTAAGQALFVSAVEAAFLPDFAPGNQFPFTRLRIRIDLPQTGDYIVTHPWGVIHYNNVSAINDSFDIQFFADQLGYKGRIGPILTWDSYPTDPILDTNADGIADHIGDLAFGPHPVKGSPLGTNLFRVDGPNIGGTGVNFVETDLFTVTGKVFTGVAPAALFVDRTTYARTVNGQVDVFAKAAPTASVSVSGGPNLPATPTALTGDGTGLFFGSIPIGDAGNLPASVTVTANNPGSGQTALIRSLTDLVIVTQAQYGLSTHTLTVNATSSDQSTTNAPILSLGGFGPFAIPPLATGALDLNPVTDPVTGLVISYTIDVGPVAAPPASVSVSSTAGGQGTAQVTVVAGATPGNTPPVARDDIVATNEDTALVINVLANDSDPDAPANTIDPTTVTIGGTGPANGNAVVNTTTGAVTYTPNLNFNGSDSFTYVVRDTLGAFSNVATVSISIAPVNDPPNAVNDVASVNINNSVTINVVANDTDPEFNILPGTVTIVTPPAPNLGTATAQPNGTVIFAAGATAGVTTFTYTVADGGGAVSNAATVTVNVNNVAAEVVTITQAQFRTRQARWTITGTTTVPGPGNQMTAILLRGTTVRGTIGSAVVTAAGAFTIDVRNSPLVPNAGDVVRVTSTFGGTTTQTVSIRN